MPPTQAIGGTAAPAAAAPEAVNRPKSAFVHVASLVGGVGGFVLTRTLARVDPLLAIIAVLVLIGVAALFSRKRPPA